LFTSAFLLFLVQPMFARLVLPLLGGSPSVWTTCMLFFQSGLLAGYAYPHFTTPSLGVRRQALLHAALVLVPLFMLPIELPPGSRAVDELRPIAWLLRVMLVSVGLPFFVLATTAPLLQRWFAATGHRVARDPYFLYAASNAGSLVALVAYPTVVEPLLPLSSQARLWAFGYLIAAALVLLCVGVLHRTAGANPLTVERVAQDRIEPPTIRRRLEWLALAFVPSSLMLAVTTYISTDVAAVPLLWIVPLTIYLLTFIIAFGGRRDVAMVLAARSLPLLLLPLLLLLIAQGLAPLWFAIPLHLANFAVVSLLCLGRLVQRRPATEHLTEFYLWLAAGGMLGGLFNTIIAPTVFTTIVEYPLVLVGACFLLASASDFRGPLFEPRALLRPAVVGLLTLVVVLAARLLQIEPRAWLLLLGVPALVCFSLSRDARRFAYGVAFLVAAGWMGGTSAWGRVLYTERTFFGVYRISEHDSGRFRTLYHGTTIHGRQATSGTPLEPLTYFHRGSPIADVFPSMDRSPRSVGVVGLGVGSLAAYARPEDRWTFYEIDPAVERIARDSRFFGYLAACSACAVIVGDARVSLETSTAMHDVLVLDAFSSDAIPIHLLTKEALATYALRLAPGGILAFHISNRHVELRPVVARLAREQGWTAAARFDAVTDESRDGHSSSDWVVMAQRPERLAAIQRNRRWVLLSADEAPAWSDDFSNIWTALRWR